LGNDRLASAFAITFAPETPVQETDPHGFLVRPVSWFVCQDEIRLRSRARWDALGVARAVMAVTEWLTAWDRPYGDRSAPSGRRLARKTLALLPRDVPDFTGREGELARLSGLAQGGRAVVTVISGTAGVGKTALAAHAAHRLLPQFPDGQLYADLRGYTEGQAPADPAEVLGMFLRRLGVAAAEIPTGTEERSGLLRQLLASRRVLMLLDNATADAQVRPMLPGAGASLVVVTSRSMLPGLEAGERIGLDVFGEEQADAQLAGLIGNERAAAEPEAMAMVREWCGRLPLALRVAGRLLAAHPAWPVARLAGMLADERDRLAQHSAGDLRVRAAVEVSCRQLADGDARLFRLLGLLPGPDFVVAVAASLSETGLEAAGSMLDRLALSSLVTEDATGRFCMHDLLRVSARRMCQEVDDQASRDAAEDRLVGHYVELAEHLDACLDSGLLPLESAEGPLPAPEEALAVFETERPGLLAAVGLAERRGWDQQVWRLCDSMGRPLERLRYLDDVLTVQESALVAVRRARMTPAAEGSVLGNLGSAYLELRRFEEAAACFQDALAIFREVGDRRAEGVTLDGLGDAYGGLRRFEEAIACFQDALAVYRETGDRHREGLTLTNLGVTYGGLRRFEDEISCCQDALAIHQETGGLHDLGLPLRNLGLAYYSLGRLEEAVTCNKEALAVYRETGDRHGEGLTLTNLGTVCQKLGRLEEAAVCNRDAVAFYRETGDRHTEGLTLTNLGAVYHKLGRLEEAIGCYQDAVAIYRETGDRHGEGLTLSNLGLAYQQLQRPEQAIATWRDAASAMRDAGDHEQAAHLEQAAASAQARCRWRRNP
jgi:tetratricopeptide (TPR) repeat protein